MRRHVDHPRRDHLLCAHPDSKRENFTLCHELAHFLVDEDSDEATADWAADLHNRDKVIEDVCDIVAQRLLIPDDLVRRTVAEHGVTGSALAHLFATSEASRQACAVALAQRLGGDGFVAIADMRESVVTFASRAHKGYPFPRRNAPIPGGHPLLRLGPGEAGAAKSWWRDDDGTARTYYQHAERIGHWTYAVFSAHDQWNVAEFHEASELRPRVERPEHNIACHCGYRGTARGFPCQECRQISCPQCGECRCDQRNRQARGTCKRCFTSVLVAQLDDDDLCTGCA